MSSAEVKVDTKVCQTCKQVPENGKLLKCGGCKSVSYCSKECQKTDWSHHKSECTALLIQYESQKAKEKKQDPYSYESIMDDIMNYPHFLNVFLAMADKAKMKSGHLGLLFDKKDTFTIGFQICDDCQPDYKDGPQFKLIHPETHDTISQVGISWRLRTARVISIERLPPIMVRDFFNESSHIEFNKITGGLSIRYLSCDHLIPQELWNKKHNH